MTAVTIDERAAAAAVALRSAFAELEVPPLREAGDVTDLVEHDEPRERGGRRTALVAVAAAVVAFLLGGLVLRGGDDGQVEVAAPDPLTRAEWTELVDTQCRAARARPVLETDDLAALVDGVADERAFVALLRATSARALERGVPADLVVVSTFADDALEAIADTLARVEAAARAGDAGAVEAELQQSDALGERLYLRLADAGALACTPTP
jgi:hypothetical protein